MKITIVLILIFNSLLCFAQEIKDDHIVFIGGLNNEWAPSYFQSCEKILRDKGVQEISTIMPSSNKTVMENIDLVRSRLLDLYHSAGNRPLILIAHSKGGLEVLNTLLRNYSDFFPQIVKKVIFSNTPFKGSPFMKVAIRDMETNVLSWTPQYQALLHGLKSLETEVIKADLEKSFKQVTKAQFDVLSARVFYIRTGQSLDKVAFGLSKSALFLKEFGPNDGLIPLENQRVDEFGSDMAVERNTDHTDLLVNDLNSERLKQLKKILNNL